MLDNFTCWITVLKEPNTLTTPLTNKEKHMKIFERIALENPIKERMENGAGVLAQW